MELTNISDQTISFIHEHRHDDLRRLALEVSGMAQQERQFVLQQIGGWQCACAKLPSWAAVGGLLYPAHLSMEQCSSEETAIYKLSIVERLLPLEVRRRMVDLTGGLGVDFSFIARSFGQAVYVERQAVLCDIARHNFVHLGLKADVVNAESGDYLARMPEVDLVFLDPARRDEHGGRTFAVSDCTPDVLQLQHELARKARWVMVKLSPMLDFHKAVSDLTELFVAEVHLVAVDNECKELLLVLGPKPCGAPDLYCVNDGKVVQFDYADAVRQELFSGDYASSYSDSPYLYEPNAAVMKCGCFGQLCQRYHVSALAENSHLFVSAAYLPSFPGRCFKVKGVSTMNKKRLRSALQGVEQANLSVRNFPESVAVLRKRLKLKEGGSTYIFATTTAAGEHLLLICDKV